MEAEPSRADWDDYRLFSAVARFGSFRRASAELQTSPQRLSQRVAALESRLKFKLFERLTHGLKLTPDGLRALGHVHAAETQLARATTIIRDASDAIEGECRLALGDGMGTYWFPRFIPVFAKLHPRIALYSHITTERLTAKSPDHDIQVQFADTPDEALIASRVGTLHFMPFASRDYLDANGTPKSLSDLARHRLVDFSLANSERGTFASLHGLSDRALAITNSFGTQCEAIRWGAGIGMLPSYAGLVHDNLVPILPNIRMPMPVYVCYEREAGKRPAVRATLKFIQDTVFNREHMPWFADEFAAPKPQWPSAMNRYIESRGEPANTLRAPD